MKMFVFEDVLYDYTSGMALVVAGSLEEAQRLAFEEFRWSWDKKETLETFLVREAGFTEATAVYEVGDVSPGVKQHVYGGG